MALWSASSGMAHLVEAVNAAYGERDRRKFLPKRTRALALTVGGLLFGGAALVVIAVLPSLVAEIVDNDVVRWIVGVLRWPVLLAAMLLALAVLYRVAPDRDAPRWRWVTPGAAVAAVVWLAASGLFSLYAANFGRYQATYGSLASIVVLLLWLWLTMLCVVAGAEIDAELQRQTARDTTVGPERALGTRAAFAADSVGPTAEELRAGRRR